MKRWLLLAGLVGTLLIGSANAAVAPYRTDSQAERFLQRGLKTWARIDLTRARFKSAFCVNRGVIAFGSERVRLGKVRVTDLRHDFDHDGRYSDIEPVGIVGGDSVQVVRDACVHTSLKFFTCGISITDGGESI
jgi:hypothetical protein